MKTAVDLVNVTTTILKPSVVVVFKSSWLLHYQRLGKYAYILVLIRHLMKQLIDLIISPIVDSIMKIVYVLISIFDES